MQRQRHNGVDVAATTLHISTKDSDLHFGQQSPARHHTSDIIVEHLWCAVHHHAQVFATILAMITEEVNSMLLDVRCGKAPLAMSGHILLLNWNRQVRCRHLCGCCCQLL